MPASVPPPAQPQRSPGRPDHPRVAPYGPWPLPARTRHCHPAFGEALMPDRAPAGTSPESKHTEGIEGQDWAWLISRRSAKPAHRRSQSLHSREPGRTAAMRARSSATPRRWADEVAVSGWRRSAGSSSVDGSVGQIAGRSPMIASAATGNVCAVWRVPPERPMGTPNGDSGRWPLHISFGHAVTVARFGAASAK
jgi:hypothetical protein